jgi:hypothetical protein
MFNSGGHLHVRGYDSLPGHWIVVSGELSVQNRRLHQGHGIGKAWKSLTNLGVRQVGLVKRNFIRLELV